MMWRHQSTVTLGRKYGLCHTVISCSIVRSALGAIHKGRPEPRGTHANAGGGGSVAKSGRPQIQIFTKIFEV